MQLTLTFVASVALAMAAALDLRMSVVDGTEHSLMPGSLNDPAVTQTCFWDGTAPFCRGSCPPGSSHHGTNSCGDGACCMTGYKAYCCVGGYAAFDDNKRAARQPVEAAHVEHTRVPGPFDDPAVTQTCYWDGTSPFCAGGCPAGYSDQGTSSCGDGACCWSGYKKYCCTTGRKALVDDKRAAPQYVDAARIEHTRAAGPFDDPAVIQSCYWDGTSPFCAGGCPAGYTDQGTSSCGDGACCWTGYKKYCCTSGRKALAEDRSTKPAARGKMKSPDARTFDGDYDDLCKDDELICCKPGAKKNKDCTCVKKPSESYKLQRMSSKQGSLRATDDNEDRPDDDLCKEKEHLCCNPGAETNKECGCLPAELVSAGIEL